MVGTICVKNNIDVANTHLFIMVWNKKEQYPICPVITFISRRTTLHE